MAYTRGAALAAMLAFVPAAAAGQDAPAPAAAPAPSCCTIAARTPVEIEFVDAVNSKDNHIGDSFAFRLAAPLIVDGHIVIPAGTPGVGEVVHAARARAMGKAGELILAARYLDYNGAHIPLRTLHFGTQQGRDNSGTVNAINTAAAAAMPVASMVVFLIAGGEVRVPAGTHASAQTATELTLTPVP